MIALIGAIAGVLTATITAVIGPLLVHHFASDRSSPQRKLIQKAPIETPVTASDVPARLRPVIISPRDGAEVDMIAVVRASTPYPGRRHYLVVTPLKTGTPFIQDGPMNDSSGVVSGLARFGEPEVGLAEDYLVQIRVEVQNTGQYIIDSDPIRLRRKTPSEGQLMRNRWIWIGLATGLLAFAAVAWMLGATRKSLLIAMPTSGARVSERPYVEGKVSPRDMVVWVVVHPMDTSGFWVQPKPSVRSDGSWKVQVYIGRSGRIDVGKRFEIQAFANPNAPLKEGDVLGDWPTANTKSDIVEVQRQ